MAVLLILLGLLSAVSIAGRLWGGSPAEYKPRNAAEERVLERAQAVRGLALDHPIQRGLTRSWVVTNIEKQPGHCRDLPRTPQEWTKDASYVATVRASTFGGLPVYTFTITCGGNMWGQTD